MTTLAGRALLVEDDSSWQQLLAEILEDHGLAVDRAVNLGQALALVQGVTHRLAVLDVALAGPDHTNRDGLAVLEALRRHDPSCASIVLTGFATVELAVSVILEMGAFTCLRKETFRRDEFHKLVNAALVAAPATPSLPALTGREKEVLGYLAQGLTNKEIAFKMGISTNTVKRHLKSLFARLGVNTRAGASALAGKY